MVGLITPEICAKMLKKLSEKLRAEFPATTPSYSMVKIAHLDGARRSFFNGKQVQWKVNHCSKKKRKGEKGKAKKKIDFCTCPLAKMS